MNWTHVADVRLIDPARGHDAVTDVWLCDGDVAAIGQVPAAAPESGIGKGASLRVVQGHGRIMMPLITDLAVYAEDAPVGMAAQTDVRSESHSEVVALAQAGGVGRMVFLPERPGGHDARPLPPSTGPVRIGQASWSDGGRTLAWRHSAGVTRMDEVTDQLERWRTLLAQAAHAGDVVWLGAQEDPGRTGGVMAQGGYALRLGLPGVSPKAQVRELDTLFDLASETGTRVHVSCVSNALAVQAVRQAKAQGLPVTCDVSIHHLHLTDLDVGYFDTRMRLIPPVFGVADRQALSDAVIDGTIDAVVSAHRHITAADKQHVFERARAGAPALGWVLPLMLSWAQAHRMPLLDALARLTCGPQRVLGQAGGLLPGMPADFCLVDPDAWWHMRDDPLFASYGHAPVYAMMLSGRVTATFVNGHKLWELS